MLLWHWAILILGRTLGAKIYIATRVLYTVVLWLTKGAMLAFCQRLTVRQLFEYPRQFNCEWQTHNAYL